MHTPYVVSKVPASGESFQGPLTPAERASVRVFPITMHAMCFIFVPEETGIRAKTHPFAARLLAAVGPQMTV